MAGVPTTAGSRAVERDAAPATADAACLAGGRAAGARIVGKTNLHELAAGTPIPASLQLVGPPRSEELLLATARQVEAAG